MLDTDPLPVDRRVPAYMTAIKSALKTDFLGGEVRARVSAYYLGALHYVHGEISPRRSERTTALFDADRHDGISLQYILAGTARGRTRQRTVVSTPGTLMLLDFSQPFVMIDDERRVVINIAFPRAMIADMVPRPAALHGLVLAGAVARPVGMALESLWPLLPTMTVAQGELAERSLIELVRLTLAISQGKGGERPEEQLRIKALREIDARLGSAELTPAWLAERLKVSRGDLYAAFRDEGGVAKAIGRRRVEAAHAILSDPTDRRRVGEIAFALGFADPSHLARAVRQTFGRTPSAIRRDG